MPDESESPPDSQVESDRSDGTRREGSEDDEADPPEPNGPPDADGASRLSEDVDDADVGDLADDADVDDTDDVDDVAEDVHDSDDGDDADVEDHAGGPDDHTATPVDTAVDSTPPLDDDIPEDVRKYDKFKKIDGSTYERANEFLRDRTYITAREWAIARLCADFRTETGVEMTKIGENLPHLVPFMTDTYSPQAVNQARASFEEKVRKSGATFLYGAMCDFFTAEELDDVMYEATEVAKFLLEVEGVELDVEDELEAEDRISEVMRDVREHSVALRHDEVTCPECDHQFEAGE